MEHKKLISIKSLKDEWRIDFNKSKLEIDRIFKSEYKAYTDNPDSYKAEQFDVARLQKICKNIEPQFIPYSSLTDIIFSMDVSFEKDQEQETDFVTVIQSKVNKHLITTYRVETGLENESAPYIEGALSLDKLSWDTDEIIDIEKITEEDKSSIIVIHKLIEHINLAISQKRGLYEKQKKEIDSLSLQLNTIKIKAEESLSRYNEINQKQNEIVSQYISILGIFAAILMTTFGGIQAFTSIYKDNSFNLVDSLLIACIGFLGILLMLFLLLNSIAKLSGKNIYSNQAGSKWYYRHPMFINSFIILTTLIITLVSYKVTINPPTISLWNSVYFIPILYLIFMLKAFNRFSLLGFIKDIKK
ncbi:TPA: hypothetical protein R1940_000510 [Staphylococcus delphini]|uniref:hypothetical protein n=1 Tax=Staphylococcus delphini TaxID=53344 RepID=UPI000BBBF753|nr:hypothetical protein [Staphylococcus delphini]PCF34687.1 hypothetical protein B5C00_04430 [Staphylococcus delphini]HEC2181960.1 hypothetical protein [Staphylococcus delphini]HEC2189460.1 hypothetical protein [Staphylococcus delphini]HEC2201596.1 hypothetical protein [Staphylococcus delphini]HEC2204303.1 hypothetical protein [Staphylococcus delphini]